MGKRFRIVFEMSNPNVLDNAESVERFKEELKRRNLGYVDSKTGDVVYDEENDTEVIALFEEYVAKK